MFKNKKILLGVTGGIAAYKAVDVASMLTKLGAEVRTILTSNACELISPVTFKSITHQKVVTRLFDAEADIEHISLADWADLVLIAPATANIIGKVASGIADDLLSTTIMATTAPVCFVPAMNIHMYENPLVQENIQKLTDHGYFFMEPEYGKLACGYEGKGRFPKTNEIIHFAGTYLSYKQDLKDIPILITAGACRESIDPMRFITNYSSGKMGLALARAAHFRGAKVTLVHAAVAEEIPEYFKSIETISAQEMYDIVINEFPKHKITIKTAAVADFTPATKSDHKIKKSDSLNLQMKRTKDILAELGRQKTRDQILVGFAAETENIVENARKKLKAKNLDFIAANNLNVSGKDETEITLISPEVEEKICGTKFEVAHTILDKLKEKLHG
ncbi:MAG: bifunctional phosphopantothenoylcysteine decarboxylase/phosphopantothenate--cysteine ligase CoaBC [Candidatus Cloacimonetes bacterium]|nr:bifunctional phosphopantothenoylcysteine decarboxylase/phosphopantothenate--cysteine ligase CoaBC [Candidatus Cloacimonadota bacterium]MCF7813478.1 bifunctional phosphopantothenoylcysteine decarboxylase/phosphopantothenate--cysteine ligase CoaBC [Candidatus Cloacimonadota bacterium]MCF7868599.1 bifunctional phosphopantothenoylcysteine decarboxylase/phosphopantothenate--cysteine ligase CoaBC [Candidatus Cloacimonadota bacterium]MCF7883386.1 bifunctional phosphopantothenoylcysteine decarboxylas